MAAPGPPLALDYALDATRTGDLWTFRGTSAADRAIRAMTNAPVNHVGMAVVLDDLPPLIWHAELSRKLPDQWSGSNHPGVQLHDLRDAVIRWQEAYLQQAWLRQLTPEVGRAEEDALLRTIARLDGVSFPSMGRLALRWLRGRGARLKVLLDRSTATPPAVRPRAAYCAEIVAATYQDMGILPGTLPLNWYDPGRFWSGDKLPLNPGWSLGQEIAVLPRG